VRGIRRLAGILSLAHATYSCALLAPEPSANAPQQAFEHHIGQTPQQAKAVAAPEGFLDFCQQSADQCPEPKDASEQVTLNADALEILRLVNTGMNRAIKPEEDLPHYGLDEVWAIPLDGYGDCEDYVLVKRKALITLGLPASALRISLVFTDNFVRHALLTVITDKGNYVLDNLTDDIVGWDKTPYTWIKWQDPTSKSGWAKLR
jgi:predicted transglutaminase-like cysteine proteinase